MREIKFRAWDKKHKNMFKIFSLDWFRHKSNAPKGFLETIDWKWTEDIVFLQYTGLKDKKGKEIYEGDIIKIYPVSNAFMPEERVEEVSFGETGNSCCMEIMGWSLWCDEAKRCEVIGNIYENKELLK